jgi:hypothetical protein
MEKPEQLTALEYIAQLLNARESVSQGYSMPTRWLTLREDLKAKYLDEAKKMVEDFSLNELDAKRRRDSF